jgi:hypothetical protein
MQKKTLKESRDYLKLLPIGLILAIVPLIVFMKELKLDESFAVYWKGSTMERDFFSYYKALWFIILTCIAATFFLFYVSTRKIKLMVPKLFIPLGVYILFVFLSSSFSKFHTQAFFGYPERYEGFFTIFCYVLICLITSVLVNSKHDLKYLFYFMTFSVVILSIIGIFQFFGMDLFQSNFGKHLILPASSESKLLDILNFKFPENYIYSALYNPNYVGGYFGMILPICLGFLLVSEKVGKKIVAGLLCIISFANLIGSLSATGWISAIISGIALFVFLRKDLKRNIIPLASLLLCFIVLTVAMNYTSGGKIVNERNTSSNVNVTTNTKTGSNAVASAKAPETGSTSSNLSTSAKTTETTATGSQKPGNNLTNIPTASVNPPGITDIKVNKNTLYLYTSSSEAMVVKFENSKITFVDLKDSSVNIETSTVDDKNVVSFKDERFKGINITLQQNVVTIHAPNTSFNIVLTKDGIKFLTDSKRLMDITKAPSFGFKGMEHWGSNRGYIWSRSLPMLKDTLLLGHGPDTYAMYFPQNDFVAKMIYIDGIYTNIDKPHDLYLQIGINTGIVSLIAFLIFMGLYCIWSIKLYIKDERNEFYTPGVACFSAVVAFLISSIANDSTISVSPTFWIILGLGLACNRLYLMHRQKPERNSILLKNNRNK